MAMIAHSMRLLGLAVFFATAASAQDRDSSASATEEDCPTEFLGIPCEDVPDIPGGTYKFPSRPPGGFEVFKNDLDEYMTNRNDLDSGEREKFDQIIEQFFRDKQT